MAALYQERQINAEHAENDGNEKNLQTYVLTAIYFISKRMEGLPFLNLE